MSTQSKPKQARKAIRQRTITAHTVDAQVFRMLDSEGKERASLSVEGGIAMFALRGEDQEPRLLLSVMPNGWALISAPHRLEDGTLDDSFRLIIANGEPEMILRDAIFKNASVVSPRGFFADEAQKG